MIQPLLFTHPAILPLNKSGFGYNQNLSIFGAIEKKIKESWQI
jgi:hypothetical protein